MTIYGRNLKRSQGYLLKNTLFNRGFEMHVPYWKKRIIPVQKLHRCVDLLHLHSSAEYLKKKWDTLQSSITVNKREEQ